VEKIVCTNFSIRKSAERRVGRNHTQVKRMAEKEQLVNAIAQAAARK